MNNKPAAAMTAAVWLCLALVVALAIGAPWIVEWWAALRGLPAAPKLAVLVSYYICMIPALGALVAMLKILKNIGRKHPFDKANSSYIGFISWCCIAIAAACAGGGVFYLPMFMVSACMLFLFLVVRVVRSCFITAAELQEDSDLTV